MRTVFDWLTSPIRRFQQWWQGEYIPPPQINPNDPIRIWHPGYYQHPDVVVHILNAWDSIKKHWQFWIGTLIGAIGIIIGLAK